MEIESLLPRTLTPILERPADDIRRRDIRTLLDAAADAGIEREAEKRRQTIGAMFRWALSQDIVEADPTAGLRAYDTGTHCVVGGEASIRAAIQATATIPIVMTLAADPVGSGFVKSLARPGGNVTGMSALAPDLASKRVEFLKEVVPRAVRVAVLWNSNNRSKVAEWKDTQEPARRIGLTLRSFEARSPEELDGALAAIGDDLPDALLTFTDGFTIARRARIGSFALAKRLPMISEEREFAEAGGVGTYGVNRADLWRRSASYVDKIARGADPGDLPVEQPTRFEMVINLNNAKALGLTVPASLLASADEVIE
jgi:putative ABC transport system substrate-binding protein